jgi:hypothetical protein
MLKVLNYGQLIQICSMTYPSPNGTYTKALAVSVDHLDEVVRDSFALVKKL